MDAFAKLAAEVDWPLLQQQKLALIDAVAQQPHGSARLLEGLVHFLDAVQDAAVDNGYVEHSQVFGAAEQE